MLVQRRENTHVYHPTDIFARSFQPAIGHRCETVIFRMPRRQRGMGMLVLLNNASHLSSLPAALPAP